MGLQTTPTSARIRYNNRVSAFWKFTWEGIQQKQKSDLKFENMVQSYIIKTGAVEDVKYIGYRLLLFIDS